MNERLDIIVFGATGFTGKHTLPYVYKFSKENGNNITWGIAGRSQEKLEEVLKETADTIGVNSFSEIPIILADVLDEESITHLTAQAKVIINCCGPFQKYGEVVVKNCINSGTHYVDVSGETFFHEIIELKYHQAAEIKGVYIVSACGFDSVATELGISFLSNVFSGTLNSMEIYISPKGKKVDNGPSINYGTWESAVDGMANTRNLINLQKCKTSLAIPNFYPTLWPRLPLSRAADIGKPNKYIVPFPSPDYHVVQRTQRYLYENNGMRPIQVKFYTLMNSWLFMVLAIFYGLIFFVMCQFQCGRNLLLKHPEFFTNGRVSQSNPSEESTKNSYLNLYFYGQGWKEKLTNTDFQYKTPPNKSIVAQLTVNNPGYGFTCISVTLAAIVLLTQSSNLPKKGGVYTPTVAFHNTSFMEEVQKRSNAVDIIQVQHL